MMVKSFVGPFVVTFAISVFALMMQVLWLYLDDIAGKGLGFFTVVELMAYKCVGLVPLAMPLALLISSVMVLGGMAEHYELSSFKSAGTSLLRVMRMLIVFGVIGAVVSFACADYVIPAANLQFGSRMYDIQQKKPTLNMEPGVFNEDFSQFAIRLGERATNGRDIADVLIYDHTKAGTGDLGQIIATDGEMYTSDDGRAFVMKLYDGEQYTERRQSGKNRNASPFVRTSFDAYTKVFDLGEFMLSETSDELFGQNRSMLATWQLAVAIDSIDRDVKMRKQTISNHITTYLPLIQRDTVVHKKEYAPKFKDLDADTLRSPPSIKTTVESREPQTVSATASGPTVPAEYRAGEYQPPGTVDGQIRRPPRSKGTSLVAPTVELKRKVAWANARQHPLLRSSRDWPGVSVLLDSLSSTARVRVMNRSKSATRSIVSQAQSTERILPGIRESRVKHVYDLHMKYSMALVCIIFVFIGAPMGAIVRKGGFGMPILVSIIFFVIFIILTIFCRKLAESFVVNGTLAGWLPCIILFPVSLLITRAAMNDTKLAGIEALRSGAGRVAEWAERFWARARARFGPA